MCQSKKKKKKAERLALVVSENMCNACCQFINKYLWDTYYEQNKVKFKNQIIRRFNFGRGRYRLDTRQTSDITSKWVSYWQ